MLTREQIAARAARELKSGETVHLGPGLPRLIAAQLPEGVTLHDGPGADVAVISAKELGANGELAGADDPQGAKRVLALIEVHASEAGSHVRKETLEPVNGRADRVLTNLALFDVTPEGLVMREVAQGVSGLDVQLKSETPLLAADDLRVIDV